MSYEVFFSYNSQDRAAVEEIARKLLERGIRCFLDLWYLLRAFGPTRPSSTAPGSGRSSRYSQTDRGVDSDAQPHVRGRAPCAPFCGRAPFRSLMGSSEQLMSFTDDSAFPDGH